MIEKMAELVNDKIIVGISDIRDESDRDGIRIIIELKKDSYPQKILNQLYKHTDLQTSFGYNCIALAGRYSAKTLEPAGIPSDLHQPPSRDYHALGVV